MRLVLALLSLVGLGASPCAQPDHPAAAAAQNDRLEPPALAEYEGRYEYHGGTAVAIVGGAVILVAVTLMASYIPARRAARLDPVVALRAE